MNRMKLFFLAIIAGLPSPATEVSAAVADLSNVPAVDQPHQRYLTLYAVEESKRPEASKVVSFWSNSLSVRKRIGQPVAVSPTLLRVDLRDFSWPSSAWEDLTKRDPYFRTEYLPPAEELQLRTATGSIGAILRADWFLAKTSIEPDYSKFLGLPDTLAELQKKFGVQVEQVEKLSLLTRGAVLNSIVALHNRQAERSPTLTGYFWQTRDVGTNAGEQAVLDNLFGVKQNAGEFIWSLPNGLQGYYLANAEGKQQQEVPSELATDTRTPYQRKIVVSARSCVGCHAEGIRPVVDVVSDQIQKGRIALKTYERSKQIALEELYLSGQPEKIAKDQKDYDEACKRVCGLSADKISTAFTNTVHDYDEGRIDKARAARELGVMPDKLPMILDRSAKAYPNQSGVLLSMLGGHSIAVDAWESVFKFAMLEAIR